MHVSLVYLQKTQNNGETHYSLPERDKYQGVMMKPDKEKLLLDLYANADFTRLYASEDKHDPVSMKSITGILITSSIVPILWSSKPHSEIALLYSERVCTNIENSTFGIRLILVSYIVY